MMSPAEPATCPTCGAALEGVAPAAFCPGCMWHAFATDDDPGPIEAATDAIFSVPGHDVIEEIARGGGGIVYRARQREPRRDVALKMLLPHQVTSEELLARFRVEAETVAMLDHPAILPVYTVGEHRGMPYFTMKLASGGTLSARVPALRGDWRAIARLVVTLAEAVQYAHARGVIHRDLKPGNVLFDPPDRVFVSDFGLAKFTNAESSVTRTTTMFGTPAYLAPELITGGVATATTASDVYGLGAILYELLTGEPPFAAPSLPLLLQRILESTPTPPRRLAPDVPRDLEVICRRTMAREPRHRFASAQELAQDLQRWLDGRPILSRPASGAEHFWRWARRHPAPVSLGAVLLLVLIVSAVALTRSNRSMRNALTVAETARATAQDLLRATLLSEGRLKRQSGTVGQRYAALESLERAARIGPSLELRSEVAAALAKADVRLLAAQPATVSNVYSMIDFQPELGTYLTPMPDEQPNRWRVELRSLQDGRVLHTYSSYAWPPTILRFSGDGQRFVVRQQNFTREFRSVDGAEPLFRDGPLGRLEWVGDAFHPTLPRVALHLGKSDIYLRELVTGEQRLLYQAPDEVMKIAYSPEGSRLALVSHNRVEVIEAETGHLIWANDGEANGVDPAWSPDGTRLAWSHARNKLAVTVADATNGSPIAELVGHREIHSWLKFSGDGDTLFSMARDQTLRMWDIARGETVLTLNLPAAGFAVSTDGTRLAAAKMPGSAVLYDMSPSGVFTQLHASHPRPQARSVLAVTTAHGESSLVLSTTFALDYSTATGGQSNMQVVVWDGRQGREAARFSCAMLANVYNNEACIALFAPKDDAIYYGSLSTGTKRRSLARTADGAVQLGEEESVAHAGPGTLVKLIAPNGDWYVQHYDAGQVVIWPEGDAQRARPVLASRDPDLMVEASPDGQWIAAANNYRDNIVRVQSATDAAAPSREVFADGSRYILLSADGRWLFASNRTDVRTWTMPDLKPGPKWTTPSDGDTRRSLAVSPDGRWLASAAARNVVEVRDGHSLDLLIRLEAPTDFQRCAWSANGNDLYLIDVAGGETRLFCWHLTRLRSELAARGLDW